MAPSELNERAEVSQPPYLDNDSKGIVFETIRSIWLESDSLMRLLGLMCSSVALMLLRPQYSNHKQSLVLVVRASKFLC